MEEAKKEVQVSNEATSSQNYDVEMVLSGDEGSDGSVKDPSEERR